MKLILLFLFLTISTNIGYAETIWIPYNPTNVVITQQIRQPVVVEAPQYIIYNKPLVLMYDWVPYHTNRLVITDKRGIIHNYRTYHYEPTIQWIYQPIIR